MEAYFFFETIAIAIWNCPNSNNTVLKEWSFCTHCSFQLYCKTCSIKFSTVANFCSNCAVKLAQNKYDQKERFEQMQQNHLNVRNLLSSKGTDIKQNTKNTAFDSDDMRNYLLANALGSILNNSSFFKVEDIEKLKNRISLVYTKINNNETKNKQSECLESQYTIKNSKKEKSISLIEISSKEKEEKQKTNVHIKKQVNVLEQNIKKQDDVHDQNVKEQNGIQNQNEFEIIKSYPKNEKILMIW
ncbi:hypothetical protein F8M41_025419 [Gigaspora margarita]|uniref:Uncharacterized protein n=1 Tax=Gigaspora margarita TaxID=4874 RepID=A0A8H3XK79_GIGMA|nr:hypothetical protein F8M41_025419 [Gigaspora margarita]